MEFLTSGFTIVFGSIVSGLILTTVGAKVAVKLANKLPWNKIEKWFYGLGVMQTTVCRSKFGKKFYEPLEEFMNKKILGCINQYFAGTRSDNKANGAIPEKKKS